MCKSMAKFFSRGINRTFLAVAYREHGVKQRPPHPRTFESKDGRVLWGLLEPVDAPPCCSGTGSLVGNRQIGKKKLCDKAVNKAWAGSKDAPRKLRRVRAMGQLLCSPAMQLPLLITDLLHLPAGYQRGCLVLQQTCAAFVFRCTSVLRRCGGSWFAWGVRSGSGSS